MGTVPLMVDWLAGLTKDTEEEGGGGGGGVETVTVVLAETEPLLLVAVRV